MAISKEEFQGYTRNEQIQYIQDELGIAGLTLYGKIVLVRFPNGGESLVLDPYNFESGEVRRLFLEGFGDEPNRQTIAPYNLDDNIRLDEGRFLIGEISISEYGTVQIHPIQTYETQPECEAVFEVLNNALHYYRVNEVQYVHVDDKVKNFILSGAPGTGKSYLVQKNIIPFLTGEPDNDENEYVERIVFTPGIMYEDFWGTYEPVSKERQEGGHDTYYEFQAGAAARIIAKAREDMVAHEENPHNYVLVIEELNRAPVYDVFGQLFQLLDRDGAGISLSDAEREHFGMGEYEKLRLPDNLFLICTMNPTDQNITTLDTAFLRRFSIGYLDIQGKLWCPKNSPVDFTNHLENGYFSGKDNDAAELNEDDRNAVIDQINEGLKKDGYTDDKQISRHFVRKEADAFEFYLKVVNYLLTIYSDPESGPSYVVWPDGQDRQFRLSTMLERYVEEDAWERIFGVDPVNVVPVVNGREDGDPEENE